MKNKKASKSYIALPFLLWSFERNEESVNAK